MAVIIEKGDTLETAIEKINKEIDTRRTYGVRREVLTTTRKAYQLVWSNANASWYPAWIQDELKCSDGTEIKRLLAIVNEIRETCEYSKLDYVARGETIDKLKQLEKEGKTRCKFIRSKRQCLDANQIAVIGLSRKTLDVISPLLDVLPLYAGSFEARVRGKFSLKDIEVPPPIARVPLDELDPQAISALVEKAVAKVEEE